MPDLTKNVPHMLKVNVAIERIITHEDKIDFLSRTNIHAKEWLKQAMALWKHFQPDPKTKTLPNLIHSKPR